ERARRSRFNADLRRELGTGQAGDDEVVLGEASVEVARLAGECGADLVVIGAMDRTWFDKLLGISPTQSVSENTACPILVIPAA
ncbi:MAG: universal stress protein, partial [Rhodobacteraceae bacterium]